MYKSLPNTFFISSGFLAGSFPLKFAEVEQIALPNSCVIFMTVGWVDNLTATELLFPCNQFGGQEPGSNEEIVEFCKLNYRNTFPVFSKIEVKGNDAHPLFAFLTNEKKGLLKFTCFL